MTGLGFSLNSMHMKTGSPVSILIVVAEAVTRLGLVRVIKGECGFTVAGEAETLAEGRRLCAEKKPSLALVDVALNGGEGFSFVREVARFSPGARVVAFTWLADGISVQRALRAGVLGYVTARDPVRQVAEALRKAEAGAAFLGSDAESVLIREVATGKFVLRHGAVWSLSEREKQVYRLMGESCSTRAMAQLMNLSVKTVETHQTHLREKLGVRSVAELRVVAKQDVPPANGGPPR